MEWFRTLRVNVSTGNRLVGLVVTRLLVDGMLSRTVTFALVHTFTIICGVIY